MAHADNDAPGHGHDHPKHLQHHFDSSLQQFDSTQLGMWLFLATEILLFGGLFCAYAIYRGNHPEIFLYAHHYLDTNMGAINTVILLISSFTMAWGVRAAQLNQRKLMVGLCALTILGGFGFMGIKYFEYKAKWEHGLLWAAKYAPHDEAGDHGEEDDHAAEGDHAAAGDTHADDSHADDSHASTHFRDSLQAADAHLAQLAAAGFQAERSTLAGAAAEPRGSRIAQVRMKEVAAAAAAARGEVPAETHGPTGASPANVQVFFSIYFLMTGLHGIHVILGMLGIFYIMFKGMAGAYSSEYFTPVDIVGLYWHLVDLIWIFLFPLLYLIH